MHFSGSCRSHPPPSPTSPPLSPGVKSPPITPHQLHRMASEKETVNEGPSSVLMRDSLTWRGSATPPPLWWKRGGGGCKKEKLLEY